MSYITGCLIPLISDCTSTLAFSSICSSVSEANSLAISSLLSGSASSLEVCLPPDRFLFAESREKIPEFEALKATPFYKTFVCHLCCEHCTYRQLLVQDLFFSQFQTKSIIHMVYLFCFLKRYLTSDDFMRTYNLWTQKRETFQ